MNAAPTFWRAISSKFSSLPRSSTTCRLLKQLPSLSSIKPKFFMSRIVRAQPQTVMVWPPKVSGDA